MKSPDCHHPRHIIIKNHATTPFSSVILNFKKNGYSQLRLCGISLFREAIIKARTITVSISDNAAYYHRCWHGHTETCRRYVRILIK